MAGVAAGLAGAALAATSLAPFVYQLSAHDPLTLVLAAGTFVLVAAAASYVPARRAARVDPMVAFRSE